MIPAVDTRRDETRDAGLRHTSADASAARCGAAGQRHQRVSLGLATLAMAGFGLGAWQPAQAQALPDAPSALLFVTEPAGGGPSLNNLDEGMDQTTAPGGSLERSRLPPCPTPQTARGQGATKPDTTAPTRDGGTVHEAEASANRAHPQPPCRDVSQLQSIVNEKETKPLTPHEKGVLAVRDIVDPFNLITIVGYSGIVIAANSHSAYGPGVAGWGRLTGYAFAEDVQGEFFGTYLIPSLVHEDPRYHRLPGAPVGKRLLHALSHTVVSQHDDGSRMPNYAVLGTYPISALLSNAYVPGIQTSPSATGKRIGIGLATDPAGAIVAEFLPDVAKRVHIRVVFVQEILNQIATQSTGPSIQ